jgi:hypothetical protein
MWVNVGSCICIDAACNQAKFKHDPRASVQQHPVMTSKNPTLTFNPATLQCTSASAASTHAEQAGKGLAASPRLFRSSRKCQRTNKPREISEPKYWKRASRVAPKPGFSCGANACFQARVAWRGWAEQHWGTTAFKGIR